MSFETQTDYPDTSHVYSLLCAIEDSPKLPKAISRRFEIESDAKVEWTTPLEQVLRQLTRDGFIQRFDETQRTIERCLDMKQSLVEAEDQKKALLARRRTIQVQLKGVSAEKSKLSLFKNKQALDLKEQKLYERDLQIKRDLEEIEGTRHKLESIIRTLAQDANIDQTLNAAKWLDPYPIALTPEGSFLLSYLRELSPTVFPERPLSYVLLYGHEWSRSVNENRI